MVVRGQRSHQNERWEKHIGRVFEIYARRRGVRRARLYNASPIMISFFEIRTPAISSIYCTSTDNIKYDTPVYPQLLLWRRSPVRQLFVVFTFRFLNSALVQINRCGGKRKTRMRTIHSGKRGNSGGQNKFKLGRAPSHTGDRYV